MDEMKISSKFTRMLLSKLAKGVLHKKLGYNVDIQLNELNASISDEKAHVHVSIDADMSKEELMKILKKIGLNYQRIAERGDSSGDSGDIFSGFG